MNKTTPMLNFEENNINNFWFCKRKSKEKNALHQFMALKATATRTTTTIITKKKAINTYHHINEFMHFYRLTFESLNKNKKSAKTIGYFLGINKKFFHVFLIIFFIIDIGSTLNSLKTRTQYEQWKGMEIWLVYEAEGYESGLSICLSVCLKLKLGFTQSSILRIFAFFAVFDHQLSNENLSKSLHSSYGADIVQKLLCYYLCMLILSTYSYLLKSFSCTWTRGMR